MKVYVLWGYYYGYAEIKGVVSDRETAKTWETGEGDRRVDEVELDEVLG